MWFPRQTWYPRSMITLVASATKGSCGVFVFYKYILVVKKQKLESSKYQIFFGDRQYLRKYVCSLSLFATFPF